MSGASDTTEPMLPALELRRRWRSTELGAATGDVLDVGAGTGRVLDHLPARARVTCLEPGRAALRRLRERAAARGHTRVLAGGAERIELPDASIDVAVCCASLCSVRDQDEALAEIGRVLRPGGRLLFFEHVAAPAGSWTRRVQRLVAPLSRRLDGGCDPARDTEAALRRSRLSIEAIRRPDASGPLGIRLPHLTGAAVRDV